MQTIFDKNTKNEVLGRINLLTPESHALWGTMTVSQMFAHCANALDMATGKIILPRQFIGRVIGWMFKSSYSNERNFPKNIQTVKGGAVTEEKDFEFEKIRLIKSIDEMYSGGEKNCTIHPHPIMGKFTPEEWGNGMYKHLDHHLRQFGV